MNAYAYRGMTVEVKARRRGDRPGWKPYVYIQTTGEIVSGGRLLLDPETTLSTRSGAIAHGFHYAAMFIDRRRATQITAVARGQGDHVR